VDFIKSELSSIQLPDKTADLIISNCTINHAQDKQAVWDEIYRILKKNGRFVVSDIYSVTPVPEEYRNDPVAVAECWAGSVTKSEYFKQLHRAGFDRVEILEESKPYAKGKVEVVSITLAGSKKSSCGSNCNCN
jgi:ubiquinone/menaquinone biosynthesis C-methylase UbiE